MCCVLPKLDRDAPVASRAMAGVRPPDVTLSRICHAFVPSRICNKPMLTVSLFHRERTLEAKRFNRARKGPESLVGEGPRRRRGTLTTTRNGRAREIYYSFIENRAFGGPSRENYETKKDLSRVICQK